MGKARKAVRPVREQLDKNNVYRRSHTMKSSKEERLLFVATGGTRAMASNYIRGNRGWILGRTCLL